MSTREISRPLTAADGLTAIRDHLQREKRSVAWLSREIGATQPHLHYILHGQRPLRRPMAERIADVLSLPIESLLPEDTDEPTT